MKTNFSTIKQTGRIIKNDFVCNKKSEQQTQKRVSVYYVNRPIIIKICISPR